MELIFCTSNQHKQQEVQEMVGKEYVIRTLKEIGFENAIEEPFDTLEENAAIKVNTVFEVVQKNCFAEDSGLFVEALGGMPGVQTARYARPGATAIENNEKLLQALYGVENRKAYFKAVFALKWQQQLFFFEGQCHGQIATSMAGQDGFGYDPLFIPEGYSNTFATLPKTVKQAQSHRAKALQQMLDFLKK
ncbi:MAG: RdgB/HAM1 family non-canonical purine NTP pyrophosphatase [Chitinophagaceae bacterium]